MNADQSPDTVLSRLQKQGMSDEEISQYFEKEYGDATGKCGPDWHGYFLPDDDEQEIYE